ncbi:esterase/lipase family protein [Nocardia asteroides]|uniref:esterase/lipase family protein n=1 Tax=Nocardia asteroides TaxID=1824 RepID=UPI003429DC86
MAATGAGQVDLVGHSMGGAIPFHYLDHLGGASRIDDYIAMGAPFHGTTLSGIQSMVAQICVTTTTPSITNSPPTRWRSAWCSRPWPTRTSRPRVVAPCFRSWVRPRRRNRPEFTRVG